VPEAWSVQAVADQLHVSEDTVRRLIAAGAFPGAFRVGRKLVRIPITDLEAYRQRQRMIAASGDSDGRPDHPEGRRVVTARGVKGYPVRAKDFSSSCEESA